MGFFRGETKIVKSKNLIQTDCEYVVLFKQDFQILAFYWEGFAAIQLVNSLNFVSISLSVGDLLCSILCLCSSSSAMAKSRNLLMLIFANASQLQRVSLQCILSSL